MDPYTGVPYFPETATNYSVNGTIVYTPCTVVNATLLNACKPPLVEGVNDGCFLTCTLPSLSDNQYLSAKILQGVVSWLSWVCCVVAWQLGDIRLHYFISFWPHSLSYRIWSILPWERFPRISSSWLPWPQMFWSVSHKNTTQPQHYQHNTKGRRNAVANVCRAWWDLVWRARSYHGTERDNSGPRSISCYCVSIFLRRTHCA